MKSAYYSMYYHLLDRNKRSKLIRTLFKSIGNLIFFVATLITGLAIYLIVPVLFVETAIKAGTNMFLICLSVAICGIWTLCWIAGIQKLIKST